ncbi:MAG TPA: adenylosuccinate synthase [Candidatus Limnocylindria bacterium]|jgi:adenylosuccinate synthase|nr:adenylosuccinate synthase [Candidatus Limnocylindria bacterium]
MANTILVGAQWGDEGKGKIIDVLTEQAEIVVRTQGGNNAGHTVYVGPVKYVLHLIPSGILRPDKVCVIGNGVVLDPLGLVKELDGLDKLNVKVTPENLLISETAHVVFPWHRELDGQREVRKGNGKIGTTKRGIGPTYGDKAARVGLRVIDIINAQRFPAKLRERLEENNEVLKALGAQPLDYDQLLAEYARAADRLRPFVTNTVIYLHKATRRHANILFEGAQGTFLDIDHGTYPFVTSSNTTSGGACTGSGVPPNRMDRVVGVMKAYTTRVGEGPLPTENAEISDLLHGMGREFGATTGRARRCGWFDAVATRHAAMVNGIDELAITNIDGLDSLKTIKVCTGYRVDGQLLDYVPADCEVLARCEPVYQEFPGWQTSTEQITSWEALPVNCRHYLLTLAQLTNARLTIASVGPAREQTMFL